MPTFLVAVLRPAALAGLLLLAACGGGGGGPEAVLSASRSLVEVSGNTSQPGRSPFETVLLQVSNPPRDGFVAGVAFTESGLRTVQLSPASETAANLLLEFKPPEQLGPGVYEDLISIAACYDAECRRQLQGSPLTLRTRYVVTGSGGGGGGGGGSGSTDVFAGETSRSLSARQDEAAPTVSFPFYIGNPPSTPLTLRTSGGRSGVQQVSTQRITPEQYDLQIGLKSPGSLNEGRYADETVLEVCYDSACSRPVNGSPLRFYTDYSVLAPLAPALPLASTTRLGHNVVDAEYSTALDAVVMVSTLPRNALYVWRVSDNTSRSVALNRTPTAVSLSPDGRMAAVGHDALVSYVTLAPTGGGNPTVRNLNVSARAGDVVLDANGFVHVFPVGNNFSNIHTVRTLTNTEMLSDRQIFAGTRAKLQPGTNFMYGASNGVSPDDLEKYSASSSGAVTVLYDSRYHGDYPMCGNLWLSEAGSRIFTACGNVFTTASSAEQDLLYNGRLELIDSQHRIASFSQSDDTREIVLVEQSFNCFDSPCEDYVSLWESEFFNLQTRYRVAPMNLNGIEQRQQPLFTLHNGDGSRRYLITTLPDVSAEETYLHRLQ